MNKISLLLLPGLLCDAEVWSYQCRQLAYMTNIIIPDLNQASTPEEMVTSALSVAPEDVARLMRFWLDQINIKYR